MRLSKQALLVIGIMIVIFLLCCLGPLMSLRTLSVRYDPAARETQVAYNSNYKLHTTPLPVETVEDICQKFGIEESSVQCQENTITYAPELFDEIKKYFRAVPKSEQTYDLVDGKLGAYLDYCEDPNPNGNYRCRYDLHGDNFYPIFLYFDKNGFYYELIANKTGIFSD